MKCDKCSKEKNNGELTDVWGSLIGRTEPKSICYECFNEYKVHCAKFFPLRFIKKEIEVHAHNDAPTVNSAIMFKAVPYGRSLFKGYFDGKCFVGTDNYPYMKLVPADIYFWIYTNDILALGDI